MRERWGKVMKKGRNGEKCLNGEKIAKKINIKKYKQCQDLSNFEKIVLIECFSNIMHTIFAIGTMKS